MVKRLIRRVSPGEARAGLPELLEQIAASQEPIIIQEGDSPIAVLITPKEFARYRMLDAANGALIEDIARRNMGQDRSQWESETLRDVEAIRQELSGQGEKVEEVEEAWAVIERLWARNADKDPDEVYADVTAEVESVRQELYDERERASKGRR